jgi:hypothetical protein
MTPIKIQDVKKGDFIRKTPTAKKTFIKESFCRFNKAYEVQDYSDINNWQYLKKNKIVYINFDF